MNYRIGTIVFRDWEITKEIGRGGFGAVYELQKTEYGLTVKSALKVVTVPQSPMEVRYALSEGMDINAVTDYFQGIVDELIKEIALMSSMKGHPSIVNYEDHKVIPHEEGVGWDILIRMELLTPLIEYQETHVMDEATVLRMAKEIADLLVYCQKKGIIHRDIKPENIFVNEWGHFKLGDFGVARTIEKTGGELSKKGTESYMAPEMFKGRPYGSNVDIYSLGQVLYRYMNKNRLPLLPLAPAPITYMDKENALVKRMCGEPIMPPVNGSDEFKSIILKACAYDPAERYHTAAELLQELNKIELKTANDNVCEEEMADTQVEEKTVILFGGFPEEVIEERQKTLDTKEGLEKEEPEQEEPEQTSEQDVMLDKNDQPVEDVQKEDYKEEYKENYKENKTIKKKDNIWIKIIALLVCFMCAVLIFGMKTPDEKYQSQWTRAAEKMFKGDVTFFGSPLFHMKEYDLTTILERENWSYDLSIGTYRIITLTHVCNGLEFYISEETGRVEGVYVPGYIGGINSVIQLGKSGISFEDNREQVLTKLKITSEMMDWYEKNSIDGTLSIAGKNDAYSMAFSIDEDTITIKIVDDYALDGIQFRTNTLDSSVFIYSVRE